MISYCHLLYVVSTGDRIAWEKVCYISSSFLTIRKEYKDKTPDELRAILLLKLRGQLDPALRTFLGQTGEKTKEARKKALIAQLKVWGRWHKLQCKIGWIIIAFSHSFKSDIVYHANNIEFSRFIDVLLIMRPTMTQTV